jgi:hypothetical protein
VNKGKIDDLSGIVRQVASASRVSDTKSRDKLLLVVATKSCGGRKRKSDQKWGDEKQACGSGHEFGLRLT